MILLALLLDYNVLEKSEKSTKNVQTILTKHCR